MNQVSALYNQNEKNSKVLMENEGKSLPIKDPFNVSDSEVFYSKLFTGSLETLYLNLMSKYIKEKDPDEEFNRAKSKEAIENKEFNEEDKITGVNENCETPYLKIINNIDLKKNITNGSYTVISDIEDKPSSRTDNDFAYTGSIKNDSNHGFLPKDYIRILLHQFTYDINYPTTKVRSKIIFPRVILFKKSWSLRKTHIEIFKYFKLIIEHGFEGGFNSNIKESIPIKLLKAESDNDYEELFNKIFFFEDSELSPSESKEKRGPTKETDKSSNKVTAKSSSDIPNDLNGSKRNVSEIKTFIANQSPYKILSFLKLDNSNKKKNNRESVNNNLSKFELDTLKVNNQIPYRIRLRRVNPDKILFCFLCGERYCFDCFLPCTDDMSLEEILSFYTFYNIFSFYDPHFEQTMRTILFDVLVIVSNQESSTNNSNSLTQNKTKQHISNSKNKNIPDSNTNRVSQSNLVSLQLFYETLLFRINLLLSDFPYLDNSFLALDSSMKAHFPINFDFNFEITWNNYFEKQILKFNEKVDLTFKLNNIEKTEKSTSLLNCFRLSSKLEILENDNQWFCSKCKSNQKATKKLDLCKTPHFLIVQLKRFLNNSKVDTFVDFPLYNLDIKDFVVDTDEDSLRVINLKEDKYHLLLDKKKSRKDSQKNSAHVNNKVNNSKLVSLEGTCNEMRSNKNKMNTDFNGVSIEKEIGLGSNRQINNKELNSSNANTLFHINNSSNAYFIPNSEKQIGETETKSTNMKSIKHKGTNKSSLEKNIPQSSQGNPPNNLINILDSGVSSNVCNVEYIDPNEFFLYDLVSVGNHIGQHSSGHYICYSKNPVTNTWFRFDDANFSPISEKEVLSRNAYLLLYRRKNLENLIDTEQLYNKPFFDFTSN